MQVPLPAIRAGLWLLKPPEVTAALRLGCAAPPHELERVLHAASAPRRAPRNVDSVDDFIPALQRLRANSSLARDIGQAGRRLALSHLSLPRAISYIRSALSLYSQQSRDRLSIAAGFMSISHRVHDVFTRIETSEDVQRFTRQCDCAGAASAGRGSSSSPRHGTAGPSTLQKPSNRQRGLTANCAAPRGTATPRDIAAPRDAAAPPDAAKQGVGVAVPCCNGWDCASDVCAAAAMHAPVDLAAELRLGDSELEAKVGNRFFSDVTLAAHDSTGLFQQEDILKQKLARCAASTPLSERCRNVLALSQQLKRRHPPETTQG